MRGSVGALMVALALVPGAAFGREAALPDPEMLEYLGGFETAKGKSVDPLLFAEEGLVPARIDRRKPAGKPPQPKPEKKERTKQKDKNDD